MTEQDRKANFQRLFPPAVEKLLDRLRVIKQKSVKGNYAWDQALVHDTWVQIARIFAQTADAFGVKFEVLVDGTEVDFVEPKSTKKRNKS
jgi:hypothetical protein